MEHKFIQKLALVVWGLFSLSIGNAQSYFNNDYGASIQNLGNSYCKGALVNEFTGQINYDITLAELDINGASYPISIGYSSSGVRVDDYASSIGLGWNLNAGGCITKVTLGTDDDFIGPNGEHIGYNTSPNVALNGYSVYSGLRDGGKDYYVYNIFGLTGKFAKFNTSDYATIEGKRVDVEFQSTFGANGRFVIHDNMGHKFYFTLRETITTFKNNSNVPSHTTDGNWFLTSVELVDGKQILLTYEPKVLDRIKSSISEYQTSIFDQSLRMTPNHNCLNGGCADETDKITLFNTFNSYRIKSIQSSSQKIVFNYSNTTRLDLIGDYALNDISVFKNNQLEKQFNFTYQYLSNRLMLTSILEHTTDFNLSNSIATFDYYNQYTMPNQFSLTSNDLMGYFNGAAIFINCKTNQISLIPKYTDPFTPTNSLVGANRSIGSNDIVQTLMLKKITDKFGAVQELKYTNNSFSFQTNNLGQGPSWTTENFYGVRVSQIINYNLTEPSKKRYVTYEYKNPISNLSSGVPSVLFTDGDVPFTNFSNCQGRLRLAGNSFRKIIGNNYLISYEYVQVYVHTVENDIINSSVSKTIKRFSLSPPNQVASFKSGNILNVKEYNSTNVLVNNLDYTYQYIDGATFPSVDARILNLNQGVIQYDAATFYVYTGQKQLKQVNNTRFNSEGMLLLSENTLFDYDNFNQIIKTLKQINNVNISAQYVTYPYHYSISTANDSYADAIKYMNQNNIRKPILESINTRFDGTNEYVVASTISLYHLDVSTNTLFVKKDLEYRSFSPELLVNNGTPSYNRLSFNGGITSFSNKFFVTRETINVDKHGNVNSEVFNSRKPVTTYSMPNGLIYARFDNSSFSESNYLGFEYYEIDAVSSNLNDNWIFGNSICFDASLIENSGYTGRFSLNFSLCNGLTISNAKIMSSNKTYTLKYWKKQGSVTIQSNGGLVGPPIVIYTNGEWTLVEHKITNSSIITISSNDAIIDDLILVPSGCSLSYMVYNQLLRVVAKATDNGIVEFYDYDALGRLTTVRDADSNILKRIEYGIKVQQ